MHQWWYDPTEKYIQPTGFEPYRQLGKRKTTNLGRGVEAKDVSK